MQKSCSNLVYVETSSAQLEFFLCNRFFLVNKARTRSKHILMLKHKFHNNLAGIIFSQRKRQRVRFAQRKLFRNSTASFQLTKKTTSPGEMQSLWSLCGKRRNSNQVSVESTVGFRTPLRLKYKNGKINSFWQNHELNPFENFHFFDFFNYLCL